LTHFTNISFESRISHYGCSNETKGLNKNKKEGLFGF